MTDVKTFLCMQCFTQVDVNTNAETKMIIDCPVCNAKIKAIPEGADASKIKYHFSELSKALRVENA